MIIFSWISLHKNSLFINGKRVLFERFCTQFLVHQLYIYKIVIRTNTSSRGKPWIITRATCTVNRCQLSYPGTARSGYSCVFMCKSHIKIFVRDIQRLFSSRLLATEKLEASMTVSVRCSSFHEAPFLRKFLSTKE